MTETEPSGEKPAALRERLSRAQHSIEPELRTAVENLNPALRSIARYHFGWTDDQEGTGGPVSGRRRLGVLTLLASSAGGGDWQAALPAAVACELAFNAAIMHDDIIDRDGSRRGRPAAWSMFGESAVMLAGVALTALAFEVLTSGPKAIVPEAVRRLSGAVTALNAGQLSDIDFERRAEVTYQDYMAMVEGKAGAFAACGCALGALFTGVGAPDGLARFGGNLGLVWQLRNDFLGVWGEPEETGKPALSDVQARKKTFPVIAALGSVGRDRDELARLYLRAGDEPLSTAEAVRAAGLIERCGGRWRTEEETRRRLQSALDSLDSLVSDSDARTDLASLASFFANSGR